MVKLRPESRLDCLMCAEFARQRARELVSMYLCREERIFIELMTSDGKLKASRKGSKCRSYGTSAEPRGANLKGVIFVY